MKCHQQTPQSLPTFLCYKYLHPKIKDIHLNFHILVSPRDEVSQAVQVPKFKYLKYLQCPVSKKNPKSHGSLLNEAGAGGVLLQ